MAESQHYRELLQVLNDCAVEFLVVGGYAVMKYTEPRFTKDLDIWVGHGPENGARVFDALARFGAPMGQDGVTSETFSEPGVVYQLGVAPVRVDILTEITGVDFRDAWTRRVPGTLFGVSVSFLAVDDLIQNKESSGRTSDLQDLRSIRKKGKL